MLAIVVLLLLVAVIAGPQLWAGAILRRYATPRPDIPGTGADFARHLLEGLKMPYVNVEQTEQGDHYDPVACAVRLSAENMRQRSLTAMVVAAHEVGHAVQHAASYPPFFWRSRLVQLSQHAEKLGSVMMLAIPLAGLISHSPLGSGILLLLGLATLFSVVLVHLVTLPVEWDASFGRAMPILEKGAYLKQNDLRAAKRILKACALTYVAQSLLGVLNLWRWIRVLRR